VGDDGLAFGESARALLGGAVASRESFVVLAEVLFPGGDDEDLEEGVVVLPVAVQVPTDGAGSEP
jgi:hypothetical protein